MTYEGTLWGDLARARALDDLAIEFATNNPAERRAASRSVGLYAHRIEDEHALAAYAVAV